MQRGSDIHTHGGESSSIVIYNAVISKLFICFLIQRETSQTDITNTFWRGLLRIEEEQQFCMRESNDNLTYCVLSGT